MVVMITPVAFETIGYQTYIIFAVINAFIVPCVYFFYPGKCSPYLSSKIVLVFTILLTETRLRSLEEMDEIFRNSTSVFNVVKVARDTPNRYGKSGELLINYLDTEAAAGARRRSSLIEPKYGKTGGKSEGDRVERLENGYGSSSAASQNEKL
jgi:hypothetical protein